MTRQGETGPPMTVLRRDDRDARTTASPTAAATRRAAADAPRVLAVASAGGHWSQLRAIAGNVEARLIYATTAPDGRMPDESAYRLPEANARRPLALAWCAWRVARLLSRVRPERVITTGAAPGLLAAVLARLHGTPAIFVDCLSNAERLSRSGRLAARAGIPTLTQWRHLADGARVHHAGTVFAEERRDGCGEADGAEHGAAPAERVGIGADA